MLENSDFKTYNKNFSFEILKNKFLFFSENINKDMMEKTIA